MSNYNLEVTGSIHNMSYIEKHRAEFLEIYAGYYRI
jgi:hypothetical protein